MNKILTQLGGLITIILLSAFFGATLPLSVVAYSDSTDIATDSVQKVGHVRVPVARPDKLFLMGGYGANDSYYNDVYSTTDGTSWNLITPTATWSPRMESTSVFFNNQLWTMSGDDNSILNELWSSYDGVGWTLAATFPQFQSKDLAMLTAFNGNLIVVDGWSGDVWSSSNGTNWGAPIINGSPWAPRSGFSLVAFKNKLWIIGGQSAGLTPYRNDLLTWDGTLPATWVHEDTNPLTFKIDDAPWAGRNSPESFVFKNQLWVVGGNNFPTGGASMHDMWYSADGINNWTNAGNLPTTTAIPFMDEYRALTVNNRILITGGWNTSSFYNTSWIWDGPGTAWNQYTAPWDPRMAHTMAVTPASFGPKPDLIVSNISTPTTTWTIDNTHLPLSALPVDITIQNIGNADANIPTGMYVSVLFQALAGTGNPGKYLLTASPITIAPGDTYTFNTDSHFNFWPITPGDYILKSYVDSGDIVEEVDNGNNMGGYTAITLVP